MALPRRRKKKKTRKPKEQLAQSLTPAAIPAPPVPKESKQAGPPEGVTKPGPVPVGPPVEHQLTRAGSRRFRSAALPQTRPPQRERVELEPPDHTPVTVQGNAEQPPQSSRPVPGPSALAPNNVFEGLDRFNWGAGSPPDTNGDAGPTYYIQTVNTSIGVFPEIRRVSRSGLHVQHLHEPRPSGQMPSFG